MHAAVPPAAPPASPAVPPGARRWLAIASLVLGLLALLLSPVLVGVLLAIPGLLLGRLYLKRSTVDRGTAWAGVWLSVVSMVAVVAFSVLYLVVFPRVFQPQMGLHRPEIQTQELAGQPAPEFALTLLDGSVVERAQLSGKRVVLAYWATWCAPCLQEVPHLAELHRRHADRGLVVIGISAEDRTVLKRFVEAQDVPYPIASSLNSRLEGTLGMINRYPTLLVLDAEGRIESVHEGYQELEALERAALGTGGRSPGPEDVR